MIEYSISFVLYLGKVYIIYLNKKLR